MTTITTTSRDWRRLVRSVIMMASLLCAALPARAADYVLTYTNNGTTYYLARNGTSGVQRVTTFDPATCIWSCASNTAGTTAGTLNNSNTYGYLYQTVNGTRYFLNASANALGLGTNAAANNYYRWRTNGTYVYNRYSYGTSYYINLANGVARATSSSTSCARPYAVTTTTIIDISTNPTINGDNVLTTAGNHNYTATGAAFRIGYKDYYFNGTDHYVDANGNNITPANATIGSTIWSLTSNSYATVNSSGVVNVGSLPESDITLTLTATITVTGGVPAAPSGTTLTDSKEITIQGTKPSSPIISVSGTNVTLSTDAVGSTTIRYTLDGTDPTASTGTVYSSAIDLSGSATSPVTIKAVTVRSGNASDVSEETVTLTLDAPVITVDGAAGTATISAAAGTTIYYTTNGSTPTTSSTQYTSALSGLSPMTTVKAIAVKSGWNNSPVASETVRIPSGADGTTVTLFDYEDHSWSYYSDPDCPIRSLSPADVKITYYGDGIVMTGNADYTASTASSGYVVPGNANYGGGAKVNVGGEDENTFIYYKTLERGDATQTAWTFSSGSQSSAASRCPYTTIYNPFQVRPTYGTRGSTDANDFTGWRGFQCWRLKRVSGGAVYSAASGGTALSTGAVINAETEIYFAPNNEYGMEVDFEAVWARAYLIKGNNSGTNSVLSQNVGVERNFMTLTSNGQTYKFNGTSGRLINNLTYPVTISCYYPSGEAPDYTNSTVRGNDNNITLLADTKFENVGFYNMSSYTLTANGHNLIVGRGCSGGTDVGTVRGMSDGSSSAVSYTIRLESGTYNTFALIDNSSRTFSNTISTRAIIGCDYDRAKTDNSKLSVAASSTIYGGNASMTFSSTNNRNNLTYDWYVKSGRIQSSIDVGDGAADKSIYMGNSISGENGTQYNGRRRITIEGGEMASIAGGVDCYGATTYSNYGPNDGDNWKVSVRLKGGIVRGSIYGAAAFGGASYDRIFVFTGGQVNGWVAGGCNGTQNTGGELYGSTALYIGGNTVIGSSTGGTHVGGTSSSYGTNGADGGHVFGAGCGILPNNGNFQTGTVGRVDNSTIVVADNAHIWRDVHGGGNYGWVRDNGSTSIYIAGGTIGGIDGYGNVFGGSNNQQGQEVGITVKGGDVKGGVYGGSHSWGTINDNVTMNISGGLIEQGAFGGGYGTNSNSCDVTGTVDITMTGGTVLYGLYGGGNVNSTIGSSVTMHIDGGQVGTPESNANIHGGGYGSLTAVTGNVSVTLGASTSAADSATVNGNVFGGSALGSVNTNSSNTTIVTMNKALVNGNLFGGALGQASPLISAPVNGHITVNINGGRVNGNVYGGGDVAPYSPNGNFPVVNMTGGQVTNVFGGGKGSTAVVTGNPQVILSGNAHVTGNVYGGGDAAQVTGQTNVILRD